MQFTGSADELLMLKNISPDNCFLLKETSKSTLSIVWNRDADTHLVIDNVDYHLKKNQMIFLTEFHHVKNKKVGNLRLVRFNRAFYCISDHDSEVGCRGILFFGASDVPSIQIPPEEVEKFETLWRMFELEMGSHDRLQIEMLQMMLKRLVILCTRLHKEQNDPKADAETHDLVRQFNYLVEVHFKSKHSVAEYADLMFKSPKTLSNYFAKHHQHSPLQSIQERLLLEARRLLTYTDMGVSEIAYEIGFDSVQTFSRFFKKKEGVSPVEYRKAAA
jgi:AraC-like DNA-binding protein